MKKLFLKPAILAIALFVSVLLVAPAMLYADDPLYLEYITVTPEDGEIPALGKTIQYTATATWGDGHTTDETPNATWSMSDPSIATNDGTGHFTATAEGGTEITATLEGVDSYSVPWSQTGYAWVNVYVPDFYVDVSPPDEFTYFNISAWKAEGITWAVDVTGPTTYSNSGTVTLNEWYKNFGVTLSEGTYVATLKFDGVLQKTLNFDVYSYDSSMDISVGYAGETTTFTLNVTNSAGGEADFDLYDGSGSVYSDTLSIDSDDWSYTITQTLPEGDYWAGFWFEPVEHVSHWGDGYDFSVVARGNPQPEPVEKEEPKSEPKPTPINELPITGYEKTTAGFLNLLYNRILQRNPEEEGLNAWLAQSGVTGSNLVQSFIFSQECQARISEYTNEQFMNFLYKALLGRSPEAEGLNAWLSRMAGGMTKEEIVRQFTISEEFVKICKEFGILPYDGYSNGW